MFIRNVRVLSQYEYEKLQETPHVPYISKKHILGIVIVYSVLIDNKLVTLLTTYIVVAYAIIIVYGITPVMITLILFH